MLERCAAGAAVVGLVVFGGCGSSTSKEPVSSSATTAPSATTVAPGSSVSTTAAKGAATFTDVCTGRAAAKQPVQGQTIDYDKAVKDLQFAVDHAPAEIKPDLNTLVTPLLAYYKVLAAAKGNFVQAAQDPQFLAVAQRFSQADYQSAAQRVEAWFASHCG